MRSSAPMALDQLMQNIENWNNTANGARETQKQLDGEDEILNCDISNLVLNTVHHTINNKSKYEWLNVALKFPNAHNL